MLCYATELNFEEPVLAKRLRKYRLTTKYTYSLYPATEVSLSCQNRTFLERIIPIKLQMNYTPKAVLYVSY